MVSVDVKHYGSSKMHVRSPKPELAAVRLSVQAQLRKLAIIKLQPPIKYCSHWNRLPRTLHHSDSFSSFKAALKTHLFNNLAISKLSFFHSHAYVFVCVCVRACVCLCVCACVRM